MQRLHRRPHSTLQPLAGTGSSLPYYPAQIAQAYNANGLGLSGAGQTIAHGINDTGQIVGGFRNASGSHGFLDTGGTFTTIDVPGALATEASGINDMGQIVGMFDV